MSRALYSHDGIPKPGLPVPPSAHIPGGAVAAHAPSRSRILEVRIGTSPGAAYHSAHGSQAISPPGRPHLSARAQHAITTLEKYWAAQPPIRAENATVNVRGSAAITSCRVTVNVALADPAGIVTDAGPVNPVGSVTVTSTPAPRAVWLSAAVQSVDSPGSISAAAQVKTDRVVFGRSRMFHIFWIVPCLAAI